MDIEPTVIAVAIALVSLGLVVWLSYRLLRWARSGTGGAAILQTPPDWRNEGDTSSR
jgi:hypothetical protein